MVGLKRLPKKGRVSASRMQVERYIEAEDGEKEDRLVKCYSVPSVLSQRDVCHDSLQIHEMPTPGFLVPCQSDH